MMNKIKIIALILLGFAVGLFFAWRTVRLTPTDTSTGGVNSADTQETDPFAGLFRPEDYYPVNEVNARVESVSDKKITATDIETEQPYVLQTTDETTVVRQQPVVMRSGQQVPLSENEVSDLGALLEQQDQAAAREAQAVSFTDYPAALSDIHSGDILRFEPVEFGTDSGIYTASKLLIMRPWTKPTIPSQ